MHLPMIAIHFENLFLKKQTKLSCFFEHLNLCFCIYFVVVLNKYSHTVVNRFSKQKTWYNRRIFKTNQVICLQVCLFLSKKVWAKYELIWNQCFPLFKVGSCMIFSFVVLLLAIVVVHQVGATHIKTSDHLISDHYLEKPVEIQVNDWIETNFLGGHKWFNKWSIVENWLFWDSVCRTFDIFIAHHQFRMKIYGRHISELQSIWVFLEIAIKTARFILAKQKRTPMQWQWKKLYL